MFSVKISSVCEQTGLTDRAVRFYIEKGLLSPVCEENYLGRRFYDFSEGDIGRLHEISVLRKYDFSIPEIQEVYSRPESIGSVLSAVIERKRETLDRDQGLLQALELQRERELPREPVLVLLSSAHAVAVAAAQEYLPSAGTVLSA